MPSLMQRLKPGVNQSVTAFNQAWLNRTARFKSFMVMAMALSVLHLAGCGFHLRGMGNVGQVTFSTVMLVNDSAMRADVRQALRAQLASSGVKVVEKLNEADIAIEFVPTAYRVTRTATSGLGDTSSELLRMDQGFSVSQGDALVVSGVASTYRDRQIDNAAILAANRELTNIQRQMAETLARQVIDRVNRAMLKQAKTQSSAPVVAPNITPAAPQSVKP